MLTLAVLALLCAILPAALFFSNLRVFRPPPPAIAASVPVSVLIPARDEQANIAAAVESVLSNGDVELEVIVLDDASADATAAIVQSLAAHDPRVRLERAPALPPGWNGKVHACHCLARLARYPILAFIDADVRLAPDALVRLVPLLETADLLSGVPRQITGSFSEKLLLPLIHFVLLGFLPLRKMRASSDPALGAGIGQFFLTTAAAYHHSGGHEAIRSSIHEGLHLSRLYRRSGLRTDLADLTPLAECRMYHSARATWHGLAKNAHEGLGAWKVIFPMTVLLTLGQIVPFALLLLQTPPLVFALAALAAAFAWSVRIASALRFRQSWLGASLHPLGIASLLAIQWWARGRHSLGLRTSWKGRAY